MSNNTVDIEELATFFVEESYTPYKLCKVVNSIFELNLPPQMFYTYAKKGMITSRKVDGKVNITREVAITWAAKYYERNIK